MSTKDLISLFETNFDSFIKVNLKWKDFELKQPKFMKDKTGLNFSFKDKEVTDISINFKFGPVAT